jgi:hypothetical protein
MALTKISTDGVKDDAVTAGKIPANAVGSSELADNAVDTAAIVADAVDGTKIADNSINSEHYVNASIDAVHIANNSITAGQIANDAVGSGELSSNAVTTAKIADEAVTLAKLEHGTGSNDGKFLRANNGADPTFESVTAPAITSIASDGDNRVIVSDGDGTATCSNQMQFDGNILQLMGTNNSSAFQINPGGNAGTIVLDRNGYVTSMIRASDGGSNVGGSSGGGARLHLAKEKIHFRTFPYVGQVGDAVTYTTRASITTDGLTFNGDTAAANALDDYEEGTWTPTMTYSGGGSATLSEALGHYTKIGRFVNIMLTITCSAQGGGSGDVQFNNLPFQAGSTTGFRINGFATYATGFNSINSIPVLYYGGSGTIMQLFHWGGAGAASNMVNVTRNNITSSTTIRASINYYVD